MKLFGVVGSAQKNTLIHAADVALNPMEEGSGTNLKMLEYAALGTLIISTPFGNRGLDFEHKKHLILAQRSGIASALNEVINDFYDVSLYQDNAFLLCKSNYCWSVINQTLSRIPIH